jgi:hypothetical protein
MRALNLESVNDFLDAIGDIRKVHLEHRDSRVRGYNVFRILGVEEQEVSLHSAFLVHLFDPLGVHGQGSLFLDSFLNEIGITRRASDWSCEREWPIPSGRIDILLQSKKDQVSIAIENKIHASDEATQLRRYRDWLDRSYRLQRFSRRRLLFLTLDGERSKQPNAEGVDYQCISYREHILRFLRKAMDKIAAAEVKNTVKQYIDTLKLILGETSMQDPIEAEIIRTSLQPKYVGTALAMARCAPKIVDALLCDFWAKGKKRLEEKLKTSGFRFWTVIQSKTRPNEAEYYLALVPQLARDRPKIAIYFYQYRTQNLFRLERNVEFAGSRVSDAAERIKRRVDQLLETKALKRGLEAADMRQSYSWDAYQRITKDSTGIHKVLEEEASDGRYSALLFEDGWVWFVNLEEQFRKVDKAIAVLVRKNGEGH